MRVIQKKIIILYIVLLESIHYARTFHLLELFSRNFLMPCALFSMLDSPGGTGCDEVRFPVRGCWDSRDIGVFDCVKECMRFVMYLISKYVGWGLCLYISYCSVVFCLGPFGSICKISRFFRKFWHKRDQVHIYRYHHLKYFHFVIKEIKYRLYI